MFKNFKVKVLAITMGLMLVTASVFAGAKFSDVKPSHWFYTYVMKASELGIVNGYGDGTFKPNQDVTRAQVSKMLVDYDKAVNQKILQTANDEEKTINAVAKAIPSTVRVRAGDSSGSGFFVRSNYVMTNQHVVGSMSQVEIETTSGEKLIGTVVASDNYKDVALVKVNKSYNYLSFANGVIVGQTAIAIGHPFGFPNTVTKGIVGRLGVTDYKRTVMFQLDAPINFGNSGGAVINTNGQVIGMSTAKFIDGEFVEGMGYAITVGILKEFANANIKE